MKGLLLALLFFASQAKALTTPSVDSAWIASASSAAQAITTSFTTGNGSNRVLFVNIGSTTTTGHGGYNQVSSVTFNGVACSFVSLTYAVSGALNIGQEVWRLINPPASTTANVVVTYSIATGDQNGYTVGQYKDVDQTTPIGTKAKSTALASPSTTSFTSTYSSAALVCATNWYAGGASASQITVDAGTVKRAESDFGLAGNSQMTANAAATQSSVSNTFSSPGTFSAAAQIVYEIVPVQPVSATGQRSPFYWNRQSPKRGPMTGGLR